jgi:hypothetical protein
MLVRDLKDESKTSARALRIYLLLIGLAENRRTITYTDLGKRIEYGRRSLNRPLGCIMRWCKANRLPALTSIVVLKTGLPGEGLSAIDVKKAPKAHSKVFQEDWSCYAPPTVEELEEYER